MRAFTQGASVYCLIRRTKERETEREREREEVGGTFSGGGGGGDHLECEWGTKITSGGPIENEAGSLKGALFRAVSSLKRSPGGPFLLWQGPPGDQLKGGTKPDPTPVSDSLDCGHILHDCGVVWSAITGVYALFTSYMTGEFCGLSLEFMHYSHPTWLGSFVVYHWSLCTIHILHDWGVLWSAITGVYALFTSYMTGEFCGLLSLEFMHYSHPIWLGSFVVCYHWSLCTIHILQDWSFAVCYHWRYALFTSYRTEFCGLLSLALSSVHFLQDCEF